MSDQKRSENSYNSSFQQNNGSPPQYASVIPNQQSFYPVQQPQLYHTSNVIQVPSAVYYQHPIPYPTIYRNNVVLVNTPIASLSRSGYPSYMCRPAYLPSIDLLRINLIENFPTCYVVWAVATTALYCLAIAALLYS